jgi:hypothetical protein
MPLVPPLSVLRTSPLDFLQLLQRLPTPLLEFKCQPTHTQAVLESVVMVFVKLVSDLPLVLLMGLALKTVVCLLSLASAGVASVETACLLLAYVNAMLDTKAPPALNALLVSLATAVSALPVSPH